MSNDTIQDIKDTTKADTADQATGVYGSGADTYYTKDGIRVPTEEAEEIILRGDSIENPNAGAGYYRKFFTEMGFDNVVDFDTTSSAGDWTFIVIKDNEPYYAFQENRYPYRGFRYSVDLYEFVDMDIMRWLYNEGYLKEEVG